MDRSTLKNQLNSLLIPKGLYISIENLIESAPESSLDAISDFLMKTSSQQKELLEKLIRSNPDGLVSGLKNLKRNSHQEKVEYLHELELSDVESEIDNELYEL